MDGIRSGAAIARIYFFCLAPTIYPASPERMAARQIGRSVQVRLADGSKSFTRPVKMTPITSPMRPERITRNNEEPFIEDRVQRMRRLSIAAGPPYNPVMLVQPLCHLGGLSYRQEEPVSTHLLETVPRTLRRPEVPRLAVLSRSLLLREALARRLALLKGEVTAGAG